VIIDNWKEAILIWLRQNKIERIEQSVEPVQNYLPLSHTLKFFDKDDKCVYENIFNMPRVKLISDIFKLYKFPTFVEVDE